MELSRVFIVHHSPLFAQGLCALLTKVSSLEVLGIGADKQENPTAWDEVARLAPDVIIFEEGDDIPLQRIVQASPQSRLVSLSLNDNRIHVYVRHDIEGQGLEGIVEAVARAAERD